MASGEKLLTFKKYNEHIWYAGPREDGRHQHHQPDDLSKERRREIVI